MATYYQYGQNGRVYTSMHSFDLLPVHQDPVGAYLAERERFYSAYANLGPYYVQEPAFIIDAQQFGHYALGEQEPWLGANTDSYDHRAPVFPDDQTVYANQHHSYPDPEQIRHLHQLHHLLPLLQPQRRLNALKGPRLDVVENGTNIELARLVPKKLLNLCWGRKIVAKFLKTVEHKDGKHWKDDTVCQVLCLPQGSTSRTAMQILVSWMVQACQSHTTDGILPVKVPKNIFVACSLAQTMGLLGLHKDAGRLDAAISDLHLRRLISAGDLETLWNCMGPRNKYVYAAIKEVGKWLRSSEQRNSDQPLKTAQLLTLLNKHPQLGARVRNWQLNEQHRPEIGLQGMEDLSNHPSSSYKN